MRADGGREAGFALLEALIALAVMAAVTGMFVNTLQSSALARRHGEDKREAVLVARSRLAGAIADRTAPTSGQEGRLAWQTAVTAYRAADNGPALEQVSITVAGVEAGRPILVLRSLRLAR